MDVGDPSKFARIVDLYGNSYADIAAHIGGAAYKDEQIAETWKDVYEKTGYLLDPHGACGYRALQEQLAADEYGVFLETAHPAKFKEKVDAIIDGDIDIPAKLRAFMEGTKQSEPISKEYSDFRSFLLSKI
jgi:threonine synthase